MDPVIARKTWRTVEPVHTMVYFAPEAAEEYGSLGVTDPSMGYFGSRAAPMGAVPAETVIATFFNFHPDLVRRAVPRVWSIASPEKLVDARLRAADRALQRLLGEGIASPDVAEAADLARRAALAASDHCEGRPLFAAHASLPWPEEPHLSLWHTQTLLREFRGDAHVAALVAEGITNVEALVLHAATGEIPAEVLRATRAWPPDEWNAAVEGLARRGLVAPGDAPALTEAGATHRQWVEDRTDLGALPAYEALGEDGCQRLRELARPFSRAIVDAGALTGLTLPSL